MSDEVNSENQELNGSKIRLNFEIKSKNTNL
jgi:hypothetical protein